MISRFIILLGSATVVLGLLCHCTDEGEAPTENENPPVSEKDPGAPDSVIIDLATALVYDDDSVVVAVLVVNDEELTVGTIPVQWAGDYWDYDTAYFVSDRWTDGGSVEPPELIGFTSTHAEDSSKMMIWFNAIMHVAPPGRDTIATLHFHKNPSAPTPETLEMDFTTHPPTNELLFITLSPEVIDFSPVGVVTGP